MTKTLSQILAVAALAAILAGCSPAPTETPAAATRTPAPLATATGGSRAAGCTVESQAPTPIPTGENQFPPVTSADWALGPASAKVTFTEYGDFM